MKKFYFKVQDGIIFDAIEYPYQDYVEVELQETHLPAGINAGYYRLNGSVYTLDEQLKAAVDAQNIAQMPIGE
jgi:hypothetical protein